MPGSAFAGHLHHRCGQPGKLFRPDREGRREIDCRAERADEHPLLHEARAQPAKVCDALKLDHPDRAQDANILDAGQVAAWLKAARERGLY